MKLVQTSLALIALFAMMMPCAHAVESHHHELAGVELCAADHAQCHTCSDKPCTDTPEMASIVSVLETPAPQLQFLYELTPQSIRFVPIAPPAGDLLHLLTVQLLI
jgi:hypothetical protein